MSTTTEPATETPTEPPAPKPLVIDKAGVYDLTSAEYHRDPVPGGSLSSTGARKLLPPSCPALFKYDRDNPRTPKRTFDIGHAAHTMVLGIGEEIVVVEADNYTTKAARADRDAAHAAGAVPVLRHEYELVKAMAAALRAHPMAAMLLDPERGTAEQSLFWTDQRTGIWRRARPDWVTGRFVVDYKSGHTASPDKLDRVIHDFGYHCQGDYYVDGARACGVVGDDAAFLLIVQEKTAPYLVTVVEPHPEAMRIGRILNHEAINTYRKCTETGHWPGYSDEIERISVPPYIENQYPA